MQLWWEEYLDTEILVEHPKSQLDSVVEKV